RRPAQRAVVDPLWGGVPLRGAREPPQDDPIRCPREALLIRLGLATDQRGDLARRGSRIGDRAGRGDEGGTGAGRRDVLDRVELNRTENLGRGCIEGDDPVVRGDDDDGGATVGDEQPLDLPVDPSELECLGGGTAGATRRWAADGLGGWGASGVVVRERPAGERQTATGDAA